MQLHAREASSSLGHVLPREGEWGISSIFVLVKIPMSIFRLFSCDVLRYQPIHGFKVTYFFFKRCFRTPNISDETRMSRKRYCSRCGQSHANCLCVLAELCLLCCKQPSCQVWKILRNVCPTGITPTSLSTRQKRPLLPPAAHRAVNPKYRSICISEPRWLPIQI